MPSPIVDAQIRVARAKAALVRTVNKELGPLDVQLQSGRDEVRRAASPKNNLLARIRSLDPSGDGEILSELQCLRVGQVQDAVHGRDRESVAVLAGVKGGRCLHGRV